MSSDLRPPYPNAITREIAGKISILLQENPEKALEYCNKLYPKVMNAINQIILEKKLELSIEDIIQELFLQLDTIVD